MGEPSPIAVVASPRSLLMRHGASPSQLLAPYECAKADALRSRKARDAYVAAHLLVRRVAAMLLGRRAEDLVLEQRCEECGGPHGKPVIVGYPGLYVSLSHCDAAVGAVAAQSPAAIDVEEWEKLDVADLIKARMFSRAEQMELRGLRTNAQVRAAARLWVHKECLVKLGVLSLDDFGGCNLASLDLSSAFEGARAGIVHGRFVFTEWACTSKRVTVAVAAGQRVQVSVQGL